MKKPEKKPEKDQRPYVFSVFLNIFNYYFLPYLPYLEDAESNGIALALCNPWESD